MLPINIPCSCILGEDFNTRKLDIAFSGAPAFRGHTFLISNWIFDLPSLKSEIISYYPGFEPIVGTGNTIATSKQF